MIKDTIVFPENIIETLILLLSNKYVHLLSSFTREMSFSFAKCRAFGNFRRQKDRTKKELTSTAPTDEPKVVELGDLILHQRGGVS